MGCNLGYLKSTAKRYSIVGADSHIRSCAFFDKHFTFQMTIHFPKGELHDENNRNVADSCHPVFTQHLRPRFSTMAPARWCQSAPR